MAGFAHLGCKSEKGRCAGVGEAHDGDGGDGRVERRTLEEFEVGGPRDGGGGGLVLEADGEGDDEDCGMLVFLFFSASV